MKLHLGSKEKAAETATPAFDAELGTAKTVKKRSERPKRRKRLSRRERLMLLIPAVAAVVAVAVVAFTLDRGSTYTFKGTARQYYAGNAAAIESGTKLKRSQKGETLLAKGGQSIQTDLPIYPTDSRRVVLPTDMVFVAPRSDKFYRMSYFTEVECQPGGTVIARRGNDRATVEQGFLFDGKDTYLFLEPMTVSVNGRTLQLPALSYVEAVYGGYVMVFNYETKDCFVELSDGSGTAQPPSGDYEISLLGDSMTMHDGSRSLLATEPSLFDPVV